MLVVQDLTVRFGETVAVDDVSLRLERGHVLAVLGPSGCGKSTLLRAIAGLEHLDGGTVSVGGRDLAGVPTHRRGFALMFQDGQLFGHLSVAQNIGYALRLRGTPSSRREARVAELLEIVGLPGYADRRPTTLSGGEQQRVALARSLAAEPRLLLLDEPLSALDRSLRERLATDLRDILVSTGTTALLVTHDHDEAFTVADEMAVMFRGRIVQQGPTLDVWRGPVSEEVARFLGYRSVLTGEGAATLAGAAGVSHGGRVGVRRSGVWVDSDGPLEATVRHTVAVADAQRVTLDIDGVGELEGLANQSKHLEPGDRVRVVVDRHNITPLPLP
jgi:thiamine transport system ATP-binding protein